MNNKKAAFLLRKNNETDHIVPVLYKIGQRSKIDVDVILGKKIKPEDYRIKTIDKFENINIINRTDVFKSKSYNVDVIEKIHNKALNKFFGNKNVDIDEAHTLVGFDWQVAKKSVTKSLGKRKDLNTVVIPHGNSPFENSISNSGRFRNLTRSNYRSQDDLSKIANKQYNKMKGYDYYLFPNERSAKRIRGRVSNNQIKVLGSTRYNKEWLEVLSEISPPAKITEKNPIKVVLFLRKEKYFVSKEEILYTLDMLEDFPNIQVVVKEHPRERLLDPSAVDEKDNISIIKDHIPSTSLIDWGDIFLSIASSILFEPVMKEKPVLCLEYAHANRDIISYYFPSTDIRTKDELYERLWRFSQNGIENIYDEQNRNQFIDHLISPSNEPILDGWADFIESHVIE